MASDQTHAHDVDFKKDFSVAQKENSTVEITGELPFSELEKERGAAIRHLGKNIKLDGFREGHIPEKILAEKLGEMTILTEMAERALGHAYGHIIAAHELDVLGQPQIQITKLAPGNPFAFTLTVAVVPVITLPDYKKLAAAANTDKVSAEVTDADVEKQIKDIMRQKAAYERLQKKVATDAEQKSKAEELGDTTELPTPESVTEKEAEQAEPDLNDLTDDYVKTLGQPGQFESVDNFKTKIREHLATEKQREAEGTQRAKITDAIIAGTEFVLPQVLVDAEMNQMWAQMNEDIMRAGMQMEDYLKHVGKSEDELKQEWRPAAEKRAKLQLILNEIAKAEDVKPDKAELEAQVTQLKEQYKDADENRIRVYVASVMINEAVMKLLAEQ